MLALPEEERMKKSMKKLKLAKETVAHLGGMDLRRAAGGTNETLSCGPFGSCACETSNGPYICICDGTVRNC
jgi:hypothetical protein